MSRRRGWMVGCVLALATGLACNSGREEISPEQMKMLIWDLSQAEAFHTYYLTRDSARNKDRLADTLYSRVFALHKVNPDRFYFTLDQFRNDPARFRVLMDSVNAYGNRMREQGYADLSDTTKGRISNPSRTANE